MVKKIDLLADLAKREGARYYREVSIDGGFWQVLTDAGFIAFSNIGAFDETVCAFNFGTVEVTARVTVDRDLSPVGMKFKDVSGGAQKIHKVEDADGRHFVTIALKPGHAALLVRKG